MRPRQPSPPSAADPHRPACTNQRQVPGLAVRRAALEILLRVGQRGSFADVLLGQRLGAFGATDRRLLTQLVLGTLAWQGSLDYELAHHSTRELEELAPGLLTLLRLGLFQIRVLSRIPPHAAVDTTVNLARKTGHGHAAGFVNAVLRSTIRNPAVLPTAATGGASSLAVVYSHPEWLAREFIEWFGTGDAAALMAANNRPAPNALRLNLSRMNADKIIERLSRDGMTVERKGRFPETVLLRGAAIFDRDAWREGLFHPQSEASQWVTRLLAPRKGAFVVDCAAAPGGKTTHLAELVGPIGRVLALDLSLRGLSNTRSVAARLRHRNVFTARADACSPLPVRPRSAEFVLLDAPCTGLGTLREHPEIRWRLSPQDIARMAALQERMLEHAANAVAVGGVLVYSVCSVAPREGRDVVAGFAARHRDFEVDRRPPADQLADALDEDGYLQTRPDREGLDGFFAARLRRLA